VVKVRSEIRKTKKDQSEKKGSYKNQVVKVRSEITDHLKLYDLAILAFEATYNRNLFLVQIDKDG
jgi:hypothetical protein